MCKKYCATVRRIDGSVARIVTPSPSLDLLLKRHRFVELISFKPVSRWRTIWEIVWTLALTVVSVIAIILSFDPLQGMLR